MNTHHVPSLPERIQPNTWLAHTWVHAQTFKLNQNPTYVGRFAPSPSGKLHQGSLITALASYLHAHWHGGVWRVRVEDVDTSRCTQAMGEHQLRTLRTLGFQFDEPVLWQTERFSAYRAEFERLRAQHQVYPCTCTRSQMAQNPSAHHCALGIDEGTTIRTWRFRADHQMVTWMDEAGHSHTQMVDDFVVKRGAHLSDEWAYALAVVVDDAHQGITHVVRGEDIRASTARQIALQKILGYPTPQYNHVPLLCNAAGEKLSKSEQAPELDTLNPVDTLLHAWRFLGGHDFECADVTEFWKTVKTL
ncbi:MAG: tRNA glutamyl-Q(34) synthetase GluQRS [Burkholderiales bacterium]|nr:tRNA glutamyl-Q(34) synthetase GluQRS [Burkholderiales bacterium]